MSNVNVEIGKIVQANGIATNLHDVGSGFPVLLLHGSGPGVTAWSNWRMTLPELSKTKRVIAPDLVGFGFTERPQGISYSLQTWVDHVIGVLDALKLDRVDVIGNSLGGAIALALAIQFPDRFRRLVLMGTGGPKMKITDGLEAVWGYRPSVENMRNVLKFLAYDQSRVTDDLAKLRYEASNRPGHHEAFAAMFASPRQARLDELSIGDDDLRLIQHETLLVHGRDDQVIPVDTSIRLNQLLTASQLHVFGKCGHWVQIEQTRGFLNQVTSFLSAE